MNQTPMNSPDLLWCLPEIGISEHFVFHGIWRNPKPSQQASGSFNHVVHGIRDTTVLSLYQDTLEDAYQKFVKAGRNKPTFEYGMRFGKRIPVFLIAADRGSEECSSPFAHGVVIPELGKWAPYIVLPVRGFETTMEAEREAFAATAVHELSHVFNMQILPHRRAATERIPFEIRTWIWFDEGIATSDESWVLSGNKDWLPFSIGWLDYPERSLNDDAAWYQAALFVRYLNRRMEDAGILNFSNEIWKQSARVWKSVDDHSKGISSPTQTLTALSAVQMCLEDHEIEFSSNKMDVDDFFASGFCMDSYFLWDSSSKRSEQEVNARFCGGRAVAECLCVTVDEITESRLWTLPHLACRYFRIYPSHLPVRIRVSVELGGVRACDLKAEMAFVAHGTLARVGKVIRFREEFIDRGHALIADQEPIISDVEFDHIIVVVTNCATNTATAHSAEVGGFTVRVSAERC